jgi:hypothetical protein
MLRLRLSTRHQPVLFSRRPQNHQPLVKNSTTVFPILTCDTADCCNGAPRLCWLC